MQGSLATVSLSIFLSMFALCYSDKAPDYTFMKNAAQAPIASYYDYIIVGGGTAGCPLASTLSQNFNVLLLERGGSPYGNKNISNLAYFLDTLSDTSPASASQRFISEDGVINNRARVLGGGSCINAGFYSRTSPEYVREVGWDGTLVNQSYQWVEKVVAFEPALVPWQAALKKGLIDAGVTPDNGFTYDHIYGTKVGGTIFEKNGHRHTAADLLQYADPTRLTVLLFAIVEKILFKGKVAYGVVFKDSIGNKHEAHLKASGRKTEKGEIILSAGALGSPQLLMLSGIGPRDHLQSMGIEVVMDQPMVGQGMADNPLNGIYIPSTVPLGIGSLQVVGITRQGSYIEGISGLDFTKLIPDITIETANDADVSFLNGGLLGGKILGPLSTGHLRLRNTDPSDNPSVTFNYFKNPTDVHRCVNGIKTVLRVIQTKAFTRFRDPSYTIEDLIDFTVGIPLNLRQRNENTGKSLAQFCNDTLITIWHYHGGCRVGEVVDRDYRVIGVEALRVIDGSTFNFSPGTNPQATVMMLGRYMGIKIRNEKLWYKETEPKD